MPASSSTSSQTSASSSTSEAGSAGPVSYADRFRGLVRLTHPFPSILDGAVVAAVAALAGGGPDRALLLGATMTLLQFGIGVTNDVVDAPTDAGLKAGKPIPAGLVSPARARVAAAVVFAGGFGLAVVAGPLVLALSIVVVAIGLAYDLRLKGTAWSWLPFAVGIPILPVYGWAGAIGSLPPLFVVLVPVAVVAGAALAVANSVVDAERDAAAGVGSIAVSLGVGRAWAVGVGLVVIVVAAAVVSALAWRGAPAALLVGIAGVPSVLATLLGRGRGPAGRERAWQLEAVGLAVLGVTWVGLVAG